MPTPRLFQQGIFQIGDDYCLDSRGFHHLIRVLRHRVNESVILFNGEGGEYHGKLTKITKKEAYVHIQDIASTERESPLTLHLLQGIPRGEKMDIILQKSVELGVTYITPLYTERSNLQLQGERLIKRLHHWQQVIISACEQCGRNRLPTLHIPLTVDEAFCNNQATAKYLLHSSNKGASFTAKPIPLHVAIAIGPEGGFSHNEGEKAQQSGWTYITLGPRVLRTETASLAALATLQCLAGDFS